jgi:hypothetical protein
MFCAFAETPMRGTWEMGISSCIYRFWGPPSLVGSLGLSQGVIRPRHKINYSFSPSSEFKNARTHISTPSQLYDHGLVQIHIYINQVGALYVNVSKGTQQYSRTTLPTVAHITQKQPVFQLGQLACMSVNVRK